MTPEVQTTSLQQTSLSVRVVSDIGSEEDSFPRTVARMNSLIGVADEDYLLFTHRSVEILSPELLPAMMRMLDINAFDAVVCDYYPRHTADDGALSRAGATIAAPGGPPQRAPSWNLFGAGIAMVRRSSLMACGLIDTDCENDETLVWEILNKMSASGGLVTAIPRALVCKIVNDVRSVNTLEDASLQMRLSRHWRGGAGALGSKMSEPNLADFGNCPFTHALVDSCRPTHEEKSAPGSA